MSLNTDMVTRLDNNTVLPENNQRNTQSATFVRSINQRQQLQAAITEAQSQRKTILLDFTAKWCGPCRKIKPVIRELAETHKDQFMVYEIDVDESEELVKHFQISSMPTFIFIRENKVVHIIIGANESEIKNTCTLIAKVTFPHLLP